MSFGTQDVLVIFGEWIPRGYVSGLVQAARARGMRVIYSTMGRRSTDGTLRPLNPEELITQRACIQDASLINIPLEAGFDMQSSSSGMRPVDLCQSIKLKDWEQSQLDQEILESARRQAVQTFRQRTTEWVQQVTALLPDRGNVIIAHTMAGGVPRSRIMMPILNRVLKGVGARFFSSEIFWKSDLGQFCAKNFDEVTAQTYRHLMELSTPLVEQLKKQDRKVYYVAYSYHGTEVIMKNEYHWQTYTPYLQGFAKLALENISCQFVQQDRFSCVFNVPEILTTSSAVFPGVEIPLYTLLGALKKERGDDSLISECLHRMHPGALQTILRTTADYFASESIKKLSIFDQWPQHNTPEHMELMLKVSSQLHALNKDSSQSITPILSEMISESCGRIMLKWMSSYQDMSSTSRLSSSQSVASSSPMIAERKGVHWIGHHAIARDVCHRD